MFIEHVNLTVSDLDRAVAFYSDLLHLHVRWKGEVGEGRLGAHVGDDRCYLALFEATTEGQVEQDYERPGINHFGFVVDDLDDVLRRLQQLGGVVHFAPEYDPGRRAYTSDPDGHEIELVQY